MINRQLTLFLLVASTLFTTLSCIKKDPLMRIAQVLFVPLSPDAPAVDFSLNKKAVATTINYSATVGTASYNFPYFTTTPGTNSLSFNVSGSATNSLAAVSNEIEEDKAYSAFLIDSVKRAKLAFVKDNLDEPTPGKVKIRFFHFSTNAPAVDVTLGATGPVLFANRSFNDQEGNDAKQEFIEIDPGIYNFVFKLTGTNTAAYTTSSLNLLPDRIYTLAARGFVGGATNRALGAWFYANKSF